MVRDAAWRPGVRGAEALARCSLALPPPGVRGLALSQCCIRALGARTRSSGPSPFLGAFFPPPCPPRVGWGCFFFFFCRETLGGRLPVRWWPRPAPRVPREGVGLPFSRLRGRPAGAGTPGTGPRVREVAGNDQRPPGSGRTLFPLRDLAFPRQEGNRRSRFPRPHPRGCHFFFFLVRGQAQGFLHGAEPRCLARLKSSLLLVRSVGGNAIAGSLEATRGQRALPP